MPKKTTYKTKQTKTKMENKPFVINNALCSWSPTDHSACTAIIMETNIIWVEPPNLPDQLFLAGPIMK